MISRVRTFSVRLMHVYVGYTEVIQPCKARGPRASSCTRRATSKTPIYPPSRVKLNNNSIGAEGAKAVADALGVNGSLTSLDLRENEIGDDGAKALGEGLTVNGSLTSLTLYGNDIGEEAKATLREAVKGRDGFKLLV